MNIKELILSKEPMAENTRFIGIDGHGGLGKSTLSEKLSKELKAQVIHVDDFASPENPLEWWRDVLEKVFIPIASGATVLNYERTKWGEDHEVKPAVNEHVTSIMIIEGVSALRKEFREYISLGIFLDVPREICFERGLIRNRNLGKSEEELLKLWAGWLKDEEDYFARDDAKSYADIVIDGLKPVEDQIDFK